EQRGVDVAADVDQRPQDVLLRVVHVHVLLQGNHSNPTSCSPADSSWTWPIAHSTGSRRGNAPIVAAHSWGCSADHARSSSVTWATSTRPSRDPGISTPMRSPRKKCPPPRSP